MLFTCVSHERRRAHSLTNDERATQSSIVAFLLIPNNTFNGTGPATAVLLWPLNAGPTSLGLFLLPLFGFFYSVKVTSFSGAKSTHRQMLVQVGRRMISDPCPYFVSESRFLR